MQWGTTIYSDVVDVINEVSEMGFERLFVMGFSFGGYMVNWIQVNPHPLADDVREKVSGLIGISGLIDLKTFANTTDQLWFPEYHLGCSQDCDSYPDIGDPDSPIKSQNPIEYDDKLSRNSIPALFISGRADQRVLFGDNVRQTLMKYREECAPHTFLMEKAQPHGFSSYRALLQASYIHKWIHEIKSCRCEGGECDLSCRTDIQHELRTALNYDHQVFDNLVPYKWTLPDGTSGSLHHRLMDLPPSDLSSQNCM